MLWLGLYGNMFARKGHSHTEQAFQDIESTQVGITHGQPPTKQSQINQTKPHKSKLY